MIYCIVCSYKNFAFRKGGPLQSSSRIRNFNKKIFLSSVSTYCQNRTSESFCVKCGGHFYNQDSEDSEFQICISGPERLKIFQSFLKSFPKAVQLKFETKYYILLRVIEIHEMTEKKYMRVWITMRMMMEMRRRRFQFQGKKVGIVAGIKDKNQEILSAGEILRNVCSFHVKIIIIIPCLTILSLLIKECGFEQLRPFFLTLHMSSCCSWSFD